MSDTSRQWEEQERQQVLARRKVLGQESDALTVGLALSGGGIRSATVSLGWLQSLARHGSLADVDYLSTVSGGGYAGSFWCSLYTPETVRAGHRDSGSKEALPTKALADEVQAKLQQVEAQAEAPTAGGAARELNWLRRSGRYLAPNGSGDYLYAAATWLRNVLAIHYVIALALTTLLWLCIGAGYAGVAGLHSAGLAQMPDAAWGPYFLLAALACAAAVVPLGVAYWYVQRRPDTEHLWFSGLLTTTSRWGLALVAAPHVARRIALDYFGVAPSSVPLVVINGLTGILAAAWLWFALAWFSGWIESGNSGMAIRLARVKLTQWLGYWLKVATVVVGTGALLWASHQVLGWLHAWTSHGLAATGATLLAVQAMAGKLFGAASFVQKNQSLVLRWVPLFCALFLGLACLLLWGLTATLLHSTWVSTPGEWLAWMLALVALSWCTGVSFQFLNLSTIQTLYTARLVRAYLGASNPQRFASAASQRLTEPHAHDDMTLDQYYGHWAGNRTGSDAATLAPLHLINVTINQTTAKGDRLVEQDRKGLPLSVTPSGFLVNGQYLARRLHGAENPALEHMSLGRWIGISGAAFAPGLGRATRPELSLLMVLANVRLGYWWRARFPTLANADKSALRSGWDRVVGHVPAFGTQQHLWREAMGRFYGTQDRYWYLSDGGHFENTAIYELLRRRVDVVFCLDNGADPDYAFGDLANLMRLARVDMGAEFEPVTARQPEQASDGAAEPQVWGFEQLLGHAQGFARDNGKGRHFVLMYRIHFASPERKTCLLVVIKPRVTEDASLDLAQYQRGHADFPQESTANQFFGDQQWESYRHLGQSSADRLLGISGCTRLRELAQQLQDNYLV
jgi:hypothetical protein